ncbi:MAG TPA: hypothetical protein DD640_08975 [Clostridiales bacterium]|nr:hypothetical protein [Clostridiales bacterium]
MATPVILPKQGLQMTEGTITNWLAQEGQTVVAGKPLFAMETDKLNIEIDAPASGTLLKILKQEGDTVPITEMIAIIGEPGENLSGLLGAPDEQTPSEPAAERLFSSPRARTEAAARHLDLAKVKGSGPDGMIISRDILAAAASEPQAAAALAAPAAPPAQPAEPAAAPAVPKATPLAAKLAQQQGIKLEDATGTGARGKITRADVEAVQASRTGAAAAGAHSEQLVPLTAMRKTIAGRMLQSVQGMAQANHRMKVDMSEIVRFRERLKEAGIKVSYTDILVKVVARVLLEHPLLNSTLTDQGILLKKYVHMGVAVAVENGLVVPVIRDADRMTLQEIAAQTVLLADKARKNELQPDEYSGGTFTITNLGMFDIDEFTAIINPPESAILAVGKIDRIPVAEGDQVVIRPILVLSLTYDHRIIDGAPAAQFLQRIKQILQNPYLLL